jgi:hypothetical protein
MAKHGSEKTSDVSPGQHSRPRLRPLGHLRQFLAGVEHSLHGAGRDGENLRAFLDRLLVTVNEVDDLAVVGRKLGQGGSANTPSEGFDYRRTGVPTDMAEKLKALERENRELRQANEILRKASAYFAQAELDRRVKP